MAKSSSSLFKRLTRLFRSGPIVKRKIRGLDTAVASADKTKSSGTMLFQKSLSPSYATITSNAYNLSERLMRYQDFIEMEYTPEIAAAMDIYADETVAQDETGKILHIFSENEKIKEVLEDLFYGTLNIDFNLRSWVRNLIKYGDLFLFNDVSPEYGVVNVFPIPVNELEREENFDRSDPSAIRFRWTTLGNRILENWEVSHFRLLGNDQFLPYGSSIIEPARRIWRQLILIEDAMLVYRVVRAPDRRVFYIDVANLPPENVAAYVEEQRKNLRTNSVVDNNTGRVDLRYNPMSVDEDYFIPVRGSDSGTKIDTLAGGTNTAAVEDVEYIQKKLFAALKVPRAYLGYDEMLSSKATLAQEDIRFSRTIGAIQKTIIAELNKIAIIHLYANGFTDEDLTNFTLRLSNPSTVAQQQKLELWRTKFEIAGSVPEGMGSRNFLYKSVWGLSDDDIDAIKQEKIKDRKEDAKLETIAEEAAGGGGGGGGGGGLGGDDFLGGDEAGGEDDFEDLGADDVGGDDGAEELPDEENAGEDPEEDDEPELDLLTSGDDSEDDHMPIKTQNKDRGKPIKPKNTLQNTLYNRSRQRTHGASKTHMPDFEKMMSYEEQSINDPYDKNFFKNDLSNSIKDPFGEAASRLSKSHYPMVTNDVTRMLDSMGVALNIQNVNNNVLIEGTDMQDEIDNSVKFDINSVHVNDDDEDDDDILELI